MRLVHYSNPVLHKKVEGHAEGGDLEPFLHEFLDTMLDNDGIGLAANQVGMTERFFAIRIMHNMLEGLEFLSYNDRTRGPIHTYPLYLYRGEQFLICLNPIGWFDAKVFTKPGIKDPYRVIEGCLSVSRMKDTRGDLQFTSEHSREKYVKTLTSGRPGFTVMRENQICLYFNSMEGDVYEFAAEGLMAQVIQHELDHLNGLTIVDRCRSLAFFESLKES